MPKIFTDIDKLSAVFYDKSSKFFLKHIKEGDRVLEVGAKTGRHAKMILENKKVNYEVYDLVDNREFCKDLLFQKVDVAADRFPHENECFDVILSSNVLEHLENVCHFLRESHRVLNKGGVLLIDYPNFNNIFQRLLFFKNGLPTRLGGHLSDGGHKAFMPHKFLIQLTEGYFEVKEITGDLTMDLIFFRKFGELIKKPIFATGKLKTPFFSHNVYLALKKIENN